MERAIHAFGGIIILKIIVGRIGDIADVPHNSVLRRCFFVDLA